MTISCIIFQATTRDHDNEAGDEKGMLKKLNKFINLES